MSQQCLLEVVNGVVYNLAKNKKNNSVSENIEESIQIIYFDSNLLSIRFIFALQFILSFIAICFLMVGIVKIFATVIKLFSLNIQILVASLYVAFLIANIGKCLIYN